VLQKSFIATQWCCANFFFKGTRIFFPNFLFSRKNFRVPVQQKKNVPHSGTRIGKTVSVPVRVRFKPLKIRQKLEKNSNFLKFFSIDQPISLSETSLVPERVPVHKGSPGTTFRSVPARQHHCTYS